MRKIYLFLVCCAMALTSCNITTPSLYEDEIKDYVKFELALLDYIEDELTEGAQAASWLLGEEIASWALMAALEEVDAMEDYFIEQWCNADSFEEVLNAEVASESNQYYEEAQKLLRNYNQQMVVLSEYQELTAWDAEVEMWRFSEIRSGLVFTFTYDFDADEYLLEVEESSMENYLEGLLD